MYPEVIFTSVLVFIKEFSLPWKIVFEGRYTKLIKASVAFTDGYVPFFSCGQRAPLFGASLHGTLALDLPKIMILTVLFSLAKCGSSHICHPVKDAMNFKM